MYRKKIDGGIVLIIIVLLVGMFRFNYSGKELVLLHTNDSHGSILPTDSLGGMAERAAYIKQIREQNPAVLLVDAGDINTGQAVSNMFDARPDIEAYNYMGYDAVTVGNHEFDKPLESLQKQMLWADFPFVISNVRYHGKSLGNEYIIKIINGVKIGIFGLTTTNTKNISVYAKDLLFKDEISVARKMVKKLKNKKVDLIIGLVHLGFVETTPEYITSRKLAQEVDGLDILVDGHSHTYIEEPERVNGTWIVTANQSGNYVGEGRLSVKDGRLTGFDWKPVKIRGFKPDTLLSARLEIYLKEAKRDLQTVLGKATAQFALFQNGENTARYGESALGDLVADALKWKAEELGLKVDFALTNSGGIRAALPVGTVTKGDVLAVLPFSNVLEVIALKGSEVRCMFDFIATVEPGNGAFAQVSEDIRVVFDRENRVLKSLFIKGEPIDEERMYYMATCDYVAAGKDGYDTGLGETVKSEKTSRLLSDVLMEYIKLKKTITPHTDDRIQIVHPTEEI